MLLSEHQAVLHPLLAHQALQAAPHQVLLVPVALLHLVVVHQARLQAVLRQVPHLGVAHLPVVPQAAPLLVHQAQVVALLARHHQVVQAHHLLVLLQAVHLLQVLLVQVAPLQAVLRQDHLTHLPPRLQALLLEVAEVDQYLFLHRIFHRQAVAHHLQAVLGILLLQEI